MTVKTNWLELYAAAREAATRAYCPYSEYAVGAALLCADGTVVQGCNVENASYGATICAERTALASAVAAGKREFVALALAAGQDKPATPCGICRQVLGEFCSPDLPVHAIPLSDTGGAPLVFNLGELLPHGFELMAERGGFEPPVPG